MGYGLWITCLIALGAVTIALWRWSGVALPPASAIDSSIDFDPEPDQPAKRTDDGKYVGRLASTFIYEKTPPLETVTVRAWILQSAILAVLALIYVDTGSRLLPLARELIHDYPVWFAVCATACYLLALAIGVFRQVSIYLMANAAALPVIDPKGRPAFSYIGDVPSWRWQYSPWIRAWTWTLVTTTSLCAAFIGSELISQRVDGSYFLVFTTLLLSRWVIAAIPRHLVEREQCAPAE